jgi:hypothetical protein
MLGATMLTKKKPLAIKMDPGLLERLDRHLARVKSPLGGTVTRTGFIEAAIGQALDREEEVAKPRGRK